MQRVVDIAFNYIIPFYLICRSADSTTSKITIPCLLVIPSVPLQQDNMTKGVVSSKRLILPKLITASHDITKKEEYRKTSEKPYDDKNAPPFRDQTKYIQQKFHSDKCLPYQETSPLTNKPTKFEQLIRFLASKETQNILRDEQLLKSTLNKNKKFSLFGKHFNIASLSSNKFSYQNISNEKDLSSPKDLVDICTQTKVSIAGLDEPAKPIVKHGNALQINKETQVNHLNIESLFSNVEVLQTSDFGMQCELPFNSFPQNANDIQTQTDNFNLWLNDMEFSDFSHMETQTYPIENVVEPILNKNNHLNTYLSNMGTQTCPQEEKSKATNRGIHLGDYYVDGSLDKNMYIPSDFMNISTQTASDLWLEEQFLNTTSAPINTDNVLDFFNVDLAIEKKDQASQNNQSEPLNDQCSNEFLSNSFGTQTLALENSTSTLGTQTFDYVDQLLNDNILKNNMETQTSISFYDLLDTSLLEEFLSEYKNSDGELDIGKS